MKKQLFTAVMILVILASSAGCGLTKKSKMDLPEKPACFKIKIYNDPGNSGDRYEAVRYNENTYIPYGSANNEQMDERIINQCIGYISGADSKEKNIRVYTLAEDSKENYLMIYDTEKDLSQALFWRDISTRDQKIETPGYIDAIHYDYWE